MRTPEENVARGRPNALQSNAEVDDSKFASIDKVTDLEERIKRTEDMFEKFVTVMRSHFIDLRRQTKNLKPSLSAKFDKLKV